MKRLQDYEEGDLFGHIHAFFFYLYVVSVGYAYRFWQHAVLALVVLTVLFGSYFLFR